MSRLYLFITCSVCTVLTVVLIVPNRIGGVMVGIHSSNVVDRGFEPRWGQTKDYKICYFSAKDALLRRKTKDWLGRNQYNMFEWGNKSIRGLLFQWASTIKIQLSVFVHYKTNIILISIISSKCNSFSSWYSWSIANLALNTNHSLSHLPQ
jgi:hypothetical protein